MQDWTGVGQQVWTSSEGPFTVERRREDRTNSKWIYDLVDAQGNQRIGVLESDLMRRSRAASGTDEELDNGGVGSSATTIVEN